MVQSLQLFTGRLILTPKFCLRFARPDPHAMYMAALSRMRVQSPTANSHHHLTPRLPHTCLAAPDRAPRGRARLTQSASQSILGKPFSFTSCTALISANRTFTVLKCALWYHTFTILNHVKSPQLLPYPHPMPHTRVSQFARACTSMFSALDGTVRRSNTKYMCPRATVTTWDKRPWSPGAKCSRSAASGGVDREPSRAIPRQPSRVAAWSRAQP